MRIKEAPDMNALSQSPKEMFTDTVSGMQL